MPSRRAGKKMRAPLLGLNLCITDFTSSATFGQHEFIRNLQYLSCSTSVTLILRRSSLALRARKAHNSLAQSQNPLAPSYRTRLFLHANVDNKNWPPLGV